MKWKDNRMHVKLLATRHLISYIPSHKIQIEFNWPQPHQPQEPSYFDTLLYYCPLLSWNSPNHLQPKTQIRLTQTKWNQSKPKGRIRGHLQLRGRGGIVPKDSSILSFHHSEGVWDYYVEIHEHVQRWPSTNVQTNPFTERKSKAQVQNRLEELIKKSIDG